MEVYFAGLLYHGLHGLLSPATLIFYGLALFNAGNYTFFQTLNIWICEMALGIVSLFFFRIWFIFLGIGFGNIDNGLMRNGSFNFYLGNCFKFLLFFMFGIIFMYGLFLTKRKSLEF